MVCSLLQRAMPLARLLAFWLLHKLCSASDVSRQRCPLCRISLRGSSMHCSLAWRPSIDVCLELSQIMHRSWGVQIKIIKAQHMLQHCGGEALEVM